MVSSNSTRNYFFDLTLPISPGSVSHMIEIISIRPSTVNLRVREQVITMSLSYWDGTYIVSTKDLGIAFRDIHGRGSSITEAVADLLGAFSVQFSQWADAISEQTLDA